MKATTVHCFLFLVTLSITLRKYHASSVHNVHRPDSIRHKLPKVRRQTSTFVRPSEDNCTWLSPLSGVRRDVRKTNARNVVFFTDGTNFDDVMTLFYILKTPFINIIAIYIQGNAWANAGASLSGMRNILYMMSDAGLSIPVILGSYVALSDELSVRGTPFLLPPMSYRFSVPQGPGGFLYADTMLGLAGTLPQSPLLYDPYTDADTDAASIEVLLGVMEVFNSTSARSSISFLSTGTLTPIAKMFDPAFKPRFVNALKNVDGMYVMAGSVEFGGNMFSVPSNENAEFNIYHDALAAQYAFKNMTEQGVKTVLVPLDSTQKVPITENLLDTLLLRPKTPEAQFLGRLMARKRATWFDGNFSATAFLWDVSAAIAMSHPETVTRRKPVYIRVVTDDGPYGKDFAWTKPCTVTEINKRLCSKVDVVFELNAAQVDVKLINALQLGTNSAQRAPKCPA